MSAKFHSSGCNAKILVEMTLCVQGEQCNTFHFISAIKHFMV
mgnify:CR=1 FL=1